ncbi:MAG: histidinol dehydrogenase [Corynebacterium sp.]|nr:histidinol dehydrogenase [Corynebacterium sp.]
MLRLIDLTGTSPSTATLRKTLPRGATDIASVLHVVEPLVNEVAHGGAEAALAFGEKFDGVRPEAVRVDQATLDVALTTMDPAIVAALEESIKRVRAVHSAQKPEGQSVELAPGGVVTEKFIPVGRVGLYVPGGNAVYPSSVIMNVVPAQEAGVGSIVVCSPPQENGLPHPTVLAACKLLGVDEVWAVGGAQAIALMAYGDDEHEPVDMITGPGNIYVTAAKRLCRAVVGIDSEAGPTEIAIVADSTANPVYVAYDLISQAEHDVMAASVLITDSRELAEAVDREVEERYSVTLNADRVEAALRGEQSGIVLVDNIAEALRVADVYAAEHLEIHTANAEADAEKIRNAGAIFVGEYSPVPLGDYSAGSNHVLPTSGTARFSSGLSTHTFLKAVNLINYDAGALEDIADTVITLADAERLPAHGEAIKARRV